MLQDILPNTYLQHQVLSAEPSFGIYDILCITLPNASRTAWEVKFSDGMRLMKCFCRRFSYTYVLSPAQPSYSKLVRHTFCNISYTTGSASSRLAASSCRSQVSRLYGQRNFILTLCCPSAAKEAIARHCGARCWMAVRRQAYNDAFSQLVRDKAWEACLLHRKTNIATTAQVDGPMADCQARSQCGSGVVSVVLQSSIDESAVP